MSQTTTYDHPNPTFARLQAGVAWLLFALIGVASLGLLVLAWALGGFLFALMVPFLLALLAPVAMLTSATPPLTLSDEGMTLHTRLWGERFVAWSDVTALRDYPLLPRREAEFERRALQGKQKYTAARGVMLVVPTLPLPYRVTGFFAGAGMTGVVAATNRTHVHYDQLERQLARILAHCDERPNPNSAQSS